MEKKEGIIKKIVTEADINQIFMFEAIQDGNIYQFMEYLESYQKSNDDIQDMLTGWRNSLKRTFIHHAAYWGKIKVVQLLVNLHKKYKLNIETEDSYGYTPMDLACIRGFSNVGELEGLSTKNFIKPIIRQLSALPIKPDFPLPIEIYVNNKSWQDIVIYEIDENKQLTKEKIIESDSQIKIDTFIGRPIIGYDIDFRSKLKAKNEGKFSICGLEIFIYDPPLSLEVDQMIVINIETDEENKSESIDDDSEEEPRKSQDEGEQELLMESHVNEGAKNNYKVIMQIEQKDCSRIIDGFERTHRYFILKMIFEAQLKIIDKVPETKNLLNLLPQHKDIKNDMNELNKLRFPTCFKRKIKKIIVSKILAQKTRNFPLHWTIYHLDFASTLQIYMINPSQLFYKNENGKIPFDITISFYDISLQGMKPIEGSWIVENQLVEFINKLKSEHYKCKEQNWFNIDSSLSIYYDNARSEHSSEPKFSLNLQNVNGAEDPVNIDGREIELVNVDLKDVTMTEKKLLEYNNESFENDENNNESFENNEKCLDKSKFATKSSRKSVISNFDNQKNYDNPHKYNEKENLVNLYYEPEKICELVDQSRIAGRGVKGRLFQGTDDLKQRLNEDKLKKDNFLTIFNKGRQKNETKSQDKKFKNPDDSEKNTKKDNSYEKCESIQTFYINDHTNNPLDNREELINKLFFWVVNREHYSLIQYMMQMYNCSPFVTVTEKLNTVHLATKTGKIDLLEFIMEQDYKYLSKEKQKPREYNILEILELGTKIENDTPLHIAANSRNFDIVEYLLNKFSYYYTIHRKEFKQWKKEIINKFKETLEAKDDVEQKVLEYQQSFKFKVLKTKEKRLTILEAVNYRGSLPLYEHMYTNTKDSSSTNIKKFLENHHEKKKSRFVKKYERLCDDDHLINEDNPGILKIRSKWDTYSKKWLFCIISKSPHDDIEKDMLYQQFKNIQQTYKKYGNFYFKPMITTFEYVSPKKTEEEEKSNDKEEPVKEKKPNEKEPQPNEKEGFIKEKTSNDKKESQKEENSNEKEESLKEEKPDEKEEKPNEKEENSNGKEEPQKDKPDEKTKTVIWLLTFDDKLAYYLVSLRGFKIYHNYRGYLKGITTNSRIDAYENIKDWMKHQLIYFLLKEEFDVEDYYQSGIIIDYFALHDGPQKRLMESYWLKYWKQLFYYPINPKGSMESLKPLNQLADYYGAPAGYYQGFMLTLSAMLLPLSVIALISFIIGEVLANSGPSDLEIPNNNRATLMYSLLLAMWSTIFVEMWKRRESEMIYIWDMDDILLRPYERYNYHGQYCIDKRSYTIRKQDPINRSARRICSESIIAAIGIALIWVSFIIVALASETLDLNYDEEEDIYKILTVLIGACNGIFLFLSGEVHCALVNYAVEKENHEFKQTMETSIIIKNFVFQFANCYILLFYYSYIKQNFTLVSNSILSMIAIKQGSSIAKINILPFIKFRVKKKLFNTEWLKERLKLKNEFIKDNFPKDLPSLKYSDLTRSQKANVIQMEKDLCLREAVEECRLMENPRLLNKDYELNMISLGYILFFSTSFPLSTILQNGLNYIKIIGDVIYFARFQKRDLLSPARGIGAWNLILELLCFFSTIGNAAFVFFCSEGLTILLDNEINREGIVDTHKTDLRNLYICIMAEHLLLLAKIFQSVMIPDVPEYIAKEREKRQYKAEIAASRQRIKQMKIKAENKSKFKALEDKLAKTEKDLYHIIKNNPDIELQSDISQSKRKKSKDSLHKGSIFNKNNQDSLFTKPFTDLNSVNKVDISTIKKPTSKPPHENSNVVFDYSLDDEQENNESNQPMNK